MRSFKYEAVEMSRVIGEMITRSNQKKAVVAIVISVVTNCLQHNIYHTAHFNCFMNAL